MKLTKNNLQMIDNFVLDLAKRLKSGKSGATAQFAAGFIRKHFDVGPNSSIYQRVPPDQQEENDPEEIFVKSVGPFVNWFPVNYHDDTLVNPNTLPSFIGDQESRALFNILDKLPSFAFKGNTTSKRQKLEAEMRDLCSDYLELRGLSPKIPAPKGMPGRRSSTTDIAEFADKRRKRKKQATWKEIASEWIQKHPGDARFQGVPFKKVLKRFKDAHHRYRRRCDDR